MHAARERHETFPNILEAFFLVFALFAIEYLVAAAFRDFGRTLGVQPRDAEALVTLLGNGFFFSALLVYKRLTYRSLFHPAGQSVSATLGVLSLPVLFLVPGLLLALSTIVTVIEFFFPLSRAEEAMFERMMIRGERRFSPPPCCSDSPI